MCFSVCTLRASASGNWRSSGRCRVSRSGRVARRFSRTNSRGVTMIVGSMLVALSLLTSPGAATLDQSAERVVGARTQSDQTVQVPKGTRVEVDDCSGDTIVRTWDRDAVRVQAR